MKVLHIVDGMNPARGGVPAAVRNISQVFTLANIKFDILSIGDNAGFVNEFNFKPSVVGKLVFSGKALKWFSDNYNSYEHICFHSVWNTTLLYLYKVALVKKVSFSVWAHGSLDPFDLAKKYYFKKLLGVIIVNKILTNAKHVFCTSQKEKELLYYFGKRVDNAVVLPLSVDNNISPNIKLALREKYKIAEDVFVFLFLSRINYKKGLDMFLLILTELINEKKIEKNKIKLLIAGDDNNDYSILIKELIHTNNLGEIVIFTGMLSGIEKALAFKEADVFILPSQNENFGLAIVEALQASLPVLISKNVYIYKDLFKDTIFAPGWLCQEDFSDLKDKILEAIGDTNKAIRKESAKQVGNTFRSSNLIGLYLQYFN